MLKFIKMSTYVRGIFMMLADRKMKYQGSPMVVM